MFKSECEAAVATVVAASMEAKNKEHGYFYSDQDNISYKIRDQKSFWWPVFFCGRKLNNPVN